VSDYVQRLEERLGAERLSVEEIRDGILESYVIANRKALNAGLGDKAFDAPDEEVLAKIREMMAALFEERGGSIENPTVRDLRSIRYTLDLKLRLAEWPPEITETHDAVSEMLLQKAGETPREEGIVTPQSLHAPLEEVADGPAAQPRPAAPEPSVETSAAQEEFNPFRASLESRLELEKLSPEDARDGIIESFVVANRAAVNQGGGEFAILKPDGEVEASIRAMMRDFFAERGASFDEPSPELLKQAKSYLDERLAVLLMPEAVRGRHEDTCRALLEKVRILTEEMAGAKPTLKVVSFKPSAAPAPQEPTPPAEPAPPAPPQAPPPPTPPEVGIPVEEILARLRSELGELVREEVSRHLAPPPPPAAAPVPPSGIAAQVSGRTVFLAWLDLPDQPAYHVYRREGERWVRLTPAPLTRASFRLDAEASGELVFAVSTVSREGKESELSPEVRVKV